MNAEAPPGVMDGGAQGSMYFSQIAQPGKYLVRFKITDNIGKDTLVKELPIVVEES